MGGFIQKTLNPTNVLASVVGAKTAKAIDPLGTAVAKATHTWTQDDGKKTTSSLLADSTSSSYEDPDRARQRAVSAQRLAAANTAQLLGGP